LTIDPKQLKRLQQSVPRVLWKYCSTQAVPLLSDMRIKATRPNEFNDPFEFTPAMFGALTLDDMELFYADSAWVTHWDPPSLPAEGDARVRDLLEGAKVLTEASREIFEKELERISMKYALVCLSADPNSILMWSHYGQNHSGFAVGIDHRKLGQIPLFPVEYSTRRVMFNVKTPLKIHPNVRAFDIFRRKSAVWAYEQEYRTIWPLSELVLGHVGPSEAYFLPLVPDAVAEVRLGHRSSPDLEAKIREILARHGANTIVRRARLHPRTYRLVFNA
jgi:hypothetical protein